MYDHDPYHIASFPESVLCNILRVGGGGLIVILQSLRFCPAFCDSHMHPLPGCVLVQPMFHVCDDTNNSLKWCLSAKTKKITQCL